MKCSECQTENPHDAKFCIECAIPMEFHCPNCGAITPATGKFCKECAYDLRKPKETHPKDLSFAEKLDKIQRYLPKGLTEKILSQRDKIEGERKQVTVMFCDMAGFTNLSERLGPEEAYFIMDKIYEILIHKVHDYEGTVNEMTGDGIMALFGAPIALEDAPQRAIHSAYSIHKAIVKFSTQIRQKRREIPVIEMRIGIHTGPVVVGTLGNDLRVDFKAVGDTVNLASRIEGLAVPGATYVTENTFNLTEGFFRFESLGKKQIKGKENPVEVYRVFAPSTMKTRFDVNAERGLTPFVGRERELELLQDSFDRCKSGRGQAFSIMAEAGVGKSRLLYEFRKAGSNKDVTFLEGKCLSYSRGVAYHPVIDILKSNFNIQDNDRDNIIREKVRKGLKILEADDETTRPYLLELLSAKNGGIDKTTLGPETMKVRIAEALKRIVLKGSQIRPLIMAVEDLHWIDKSSEQYLKELLDHISGARVLLIFTYRPEFVHTWGGKSYHSQVTLNRLSNRESLAMLAYLLDTDKIDRDLEELVLNKTEGVPFFIEEFVKSLKDLRVIEKDDNTYRIANEKRAVSIPAKIQDVIMAQVDTLPDGAKGLLQTGSVIGREFSHELIKQVTDIPEREIMSSLSVLKDSELLFERGIYPQSSYIFKHALTQEVAYNSLLQKQRREIHGKIGSVMEDLYPMRSEKNYEMLAYHYIRSDDKEKALEYLDLANLKACQISAAEEAKAFFDELINLLYALPDTLKNKERRISLLLRQDLVFELLLKFSEYRDHLTRNEAAAVALGNQDLLGGLYSSLGNLEMWAGKLDRSIQTFTKAIKLCEASRNSVYTRSTFNGLLLSHYYMGNFNLALSFGEKALGVPDLDYDSFETMYLLSNLSLAYSSLGRFDKSTEKGQEAIKIAEEYSNNSLMSYALQCLTWVNTWKGDLTLAVEHGKLAVEKAPTSADRAYSQGMLGYAFCRAGRLSKGIELLRKVLQTYQAARFLIMEIEVSVMLGEGYWLAEEFEKSSQILAKVLVLAERVKMKYHIAWAHRLLGEITIKTNPNKAETHFNKSVSICKKIKAENSLALTFAGYGRLHKHQGNVAEARECFEKALEILERLGTLIEPDKIRRELTELSGN